jgi:hypothetical protein
MTHLPAAAAADIVPGVDSLTRSRRLFVLLSRVMAPGIRHGLIRSTRLGGSFCVLRTRGRRTGRSR